MPLPPDRRAGFSRRRQYSLFLSYVVMIAGAVIGAALLVIQRTDPPAFAALRMGAASVTAPVAGALTGAVNAVAGIPGAIGEHFRVTHENATLRARLKAQGRLLTQARALAYDARRLRALLAIRDRSADVVAAARLVGSTASSGRRFALLDAGRLQGVQPGMPVRGPDGVVGRIVETGPAVARVLLLTDAESLIPVRRTRDGLLALAAGKGDGTLEIRTVISNSRLAPDELFVTTGTGGLFPPGIPVARTTRGGLDTAPARPFASPDGLDFALVQRQFMAMPPATPEPRP